MYDFKGKNDRKVEEELMLVKEKMLEVRNELVEEYASLSKEELLNAIQRMNDYEIQSIKKLGVTGELFNTLITISKNHAYYDRILVDALKKD